MFKTLIISESLQGLMKKAVVKIPESCFASMNIHPSHQVLSLSGKRTAAIVSYDDESLHICQRILDENTEEDLLCSEFFMMDKDVCLALGGELGIIKMLNISKGLLVGHVKAHGGVITGIRNYNDRYILSYSEDTTVKMWDVVALRCVCIFGGYMGHRDYVLSMDVSGDLKYLASSGTDCTIKVWKIPQSLDVLQCVHIPVYSSSKIHKSFISCLRFYGNFLVSCSKGGRISTILPKYSEDEPTDEAMFIGEISVNSGILRGFKVYDCLLVALTKMQEIAIFNMEKIGLSGSPDTVEIFCNERIKDFSLCKDKIFILFENSSVMKLDLNLNKYKQPPER